MTHPDATYFTYEYDKLDRLTRVRENGSLTLALKAYDNQGRLNYQLKGPDFSPGNRTAYQYDKISRVTSMRNLLGGVSIGDGVELQLPV